MALYWPTRLSLFSTLLFFSQCQRPAPPLPIRDGSSSSSSTDQVSVSSDAKPAGARKRLLPEVQERFEKRAGQLQKEPQLVEEVRNGVEKLIEQLAQSADLVVQKLAIIEDLGTGRVVGPWGYARSQAEKLVAQLKQAQLVEAQCTIVTLELQLRFAITAAERIIFWFLGNETKNSGQLAEARQAVEEWCKELGGAFQAVQEWERRLSGE